MANGKVLRWLIVEDNPDHRSMAELECELIGHPFLSFTNGKQAMAWMEGPIPDSEIPDVALIDARMPGGPDGDKLAAHIRQHVLLSNIVIILITGLAPPDAQAEKLLALSAADQLVFKPLPPMEELVATVHRIMATRWDSSNGT